MTGVLLQPKYIALDSAHLVQWSDARVSTNASHRADAAAFEQWLEASGYVPLFCLHHIAELVNHEIEAVAARRLRFIARLPFVAWIGASSNDGPGTVVTLLAAEVQAACEAPGSSGLEIRDRAKPRLIRIGTGAALLGGAPETWLAIRPAIAAHAEQARKLIAFTRLNTIDVAEKSMAELMNSQLREGAELHHYLKLVFGSLAVDIARRADPRITDPGAMAADFIHDVRRMIGPPPATAAELVLRILATLDVTVEDIGPEIDGWRDVGAGPIPSAAKSRRGSSRRAIPFGIARGPAAAAPKLEHRLCPQTLSTRSSQA